MVLTRAFPQTTIDTGAVHGLRAAALQFNNYPHGLRGECR